MPSTAKTASKLGESKADGTDVVCDGVRARAARPQQGSHRLSGPTRPVVDEPHQRAAPGPAGGVVLAGGAVGGEGLGVLGPQGGQRDERPVGIEAAQQCGRDGLAGGAVQVMLGLVQPQHGARGKGVRGQCGQEAVGVRGEEQLEVVRGRLEGLDGGAGLAGARLPAHHLREARSRPRPAWRDAQGWSGAPPTASPPRTGSSGGGLPARPDEPAAPTLMAVTAWRAGTHPATALLIRGSAIGTACALYLTAVSAYH